jgi:hypothetical protein
MGAVWAAPYKPEKIKPQAIGIVGL